MLLLLLLQDSTFAKKECITLNRGKELKEHVSKSHVLLILADGSTSSSKKDDDDEEEDDEEEEDNDTYLQLCNRLETTPEARTKDFEIALVKDSNLKRLVMKSAQPALPNGILERMKQKVQLVLSTIQQRQPEQESGSKESKTTSTTTTSPPPKYPEYILYKMNASEGIRYLSSKEEDNNNLEEATADEISDFVSQQLGRKKIGNFVYSLGTYDLIASQIVNTTGFVQQVWAYGVARFVQVLFLQHPILSKVFKSSSSMYNDFEYDLVQEYIKIGIKVVENGLDYPSKQVQRLQKMLDDPDTSNNIGDLQKETLSQRIHILQKFSDPITVDPHDLDVFQMKMALNFLTLFLLIVMVPYVLMAKTDDDEDEEDEKLGQEDNDDDDDATNDSTKETTTTAATANPNTPMSKQEKRALAIQRAKESMQADKEKVEQVKQQRKQQGGNSSPVPPPVFSESQLNAMKVTKLKELLSDRGLKTTGKKNELIDRLMQQSS
eukprot:scaffold612_cov98-Cylindrotheca_fusiformis.AAC.7